GRRGAGGRRPLRRRPPAADLRRDDRRRAAGRGLEDTMNTRTGLLAAALAATLAACAHGPAAPAVATADADALLTVDTHVDIPLDYMRDPRYDVGGDTALQVDLGKMERGSLDGAFFLGYVGQEIGSASCRERVEMCGAG